MGIFYKGLRDNLKDKVSGKDYETLKELQALAVKYDICIQERNTERSLERAQRKGQALPPTNNSARPSTYSQAPLHPAAQPTAPRPNFGTRPTLPLRPSFPSHPPAAGSTPSAPSADGTTPMEIDAQGRRHITKEESERRRRLDLCSYCASPGHDNHRCPIAPPAPWKAAAIEVEAGPDPGAGKDAAEE